MLVIHIAELNSDQIVEISGNNFRTMLIAYWRHNCWRPCPPYNMIYVSNSVIVFENQHETLTLVKAPFEGNVYYATWEWKG